MSLPTSKYLRKTPEPSNSWEAAGRNTTATKMVAKIKQNLAMITK